MFNSAVIRELNTELISSSAAFFKDTIVDIYDLTNNNLISISDFIFPSLAWFKDTKNRADETKLEAVSSNIVDNVTLSVLNIEFLATQ